MKPTTQNRLLWVGILGALAMACGTKEESSTPLPSSEVRIKSVKMGNLSDEDLNLIEESPVAPSDRKRYVRYAFESTFLTEGQWLVFNCLTREDCETSPVLQVNLGSDGKVEFPAEAPMEWRKKLVASTSEDSKKLTLIVSRSFDGQLSSVIRIELRARDKSDSLLLQRSGGGFIPYLELTSVPAPQTIGPSPASEASEFPWAFPGRASVRELQSKGVEVSFSPDPGSVVSALADEQRGIYFDQVLSELDQAEALPNRLLIVNNSAYLAENEDRSWTVGWFTPVEEVRKVLGRARAFSAWKKRHGLTLDLGLIPQAAFFSTDEFNLNLARFLRVLQEKPELAKARMNLRRGPSEENYPDLSISSQTEVQLHFGTTLLRAMESDQFPGSREFDELALQANQLQIELEVLARAGFYPAELRLKPLFSGAMTTNKEHYIRATQAIRQLSAALLALRARKPELNHLVLSFDHLEMLVTAERRIKVEQNQLLILMPRLSLSLIDSRKEAERLAGLIDKIR